MRIKFKVSGFMKLVAVSVILVSCVSTIVNAGSGIKVVFDGKCAKCHGSKGKVTKRGKNLGAKNFANLEWQKAITDEEIIDSITNGKNKMPSWKDKLNKGEIEELSHYIRVLLPRGQRNKMPGDIKKKHYGK